MAKPNEQKPNDNKGKRTLDLHRTFGYPASPSWGDEILVWAAIVGPTARDGGFMAKVPESLGRPGIDPLSAELW
jgi:hypothetical protein